MALEHNKFLYGLPSIGWVGALLGMMALVPVLVDTSLHSGKLTR
ncbi:hypothetical protein [Xenorhabdus lircayensis]|nr:hypothetical protein [Xenorhabdus lircayensis]